jgi:hypothetical protein
MADISGSQSDAFNDGLNFTRNSGRGNDSSITLGGAASSSDRGLDSTSARWSAMTPHAVLAQASTGQEDTSWEAMQRSEGTYQPGSMTAMQDRLSDGSDDIS